MGVVDSSYTTRHPVVRRVFFMENKQPTTFTLVAFVVLYVAVAVYMSNMILDWMADQNPEPPRIYTSYK